MTNFIKTCLAAVVASLIMALPAHAGPVRQVNADGILTGVSGIFFAASDNLVHTVDVEFHDGSCASLFDSCGLDKPLKPFFLFTSELVNAWSALLGEYYVVGVDKLFEPGRTRGCVGNTGSCLIYTPTSSDTSGIFPAGISATSFTAISLDTKTGYMEPTTPSYNIGTDSSDDNGVVFAVWSLGESFTQEEYFPEFATVPEPSSLALLGLAGVALGWSQRRRRLRANTLAQ